MAVGLFIQVFPQCRLRDRDRILTGPRVLASRAKFALAKGRCIGFYPIVPEEEDVRT